LAQTLAEVFYETLRFDLPDAFASKIGKSYVAISHQELQARVERLALALQTRGLKPGDRVAFLAENRPEWAIADFACAILGLVSVPIYHTLTPDQSAFILQHSGARWIMVSTNAQLAKLKTTWDRLPELETILVLDAAIPEEAPKAFVGWDQLQEEGLGMEERRPEVRSWGQERLPGDLLTLIYTSGTTGDPKGAMLTHGNLTSNVLDTVEVAVAALRPERGDRCLSVLPISHVFERTGGYYAMFYLGIAIYYAESLISLPANLLEVQPAVLMAVPRIFEKIYARVRDVATSGGMLKRLAFGWASNTCHRAVRHLYLNRQPRGLLRLQLELADRILLSKVREKTGGRLRFCVTGGAALNPRIMEFFWAMGVPIYEGYGLTETSPILTLNRLGKVRPGYVGPPILKTFEGRPFLKLAEDGEILCSGPNVMQGYWRDETATQEAFDGEGYFRTGDVGEFDRLGRVKITDRKKEIIVTNAGKNVAPQPIENQLRGDEYIEQAVLVGDHKNYIGALIVPHLPALREWCQRKHLEFANDAEMVAHPKVHTKLMTRVNRVNAHLSNYEKIRKIVLLDREMTAENGLLTPSLKVRRRVVNEVYRELIASLFPAGE